jgi:hypothetical protein
MPELNFNRGSFYTGQESEEGPQATADEVRAFRKQYEAMRRDEKDRLPDGCESILNGR